MQEVKIGGSRWPKWRLDPILGPFLAIFGPFGPFLTLFWSFGWGAKAPSGSGPPKVGVKWCHFEPFWGPFRYFLTLFWSFGWGAKAPSGSEPPKVCVKWGGESKLAGLEGPSGVRPLWGGAFLAILSPLGPFLALFGHLGGEQRLCTRKVGHIWSL